KKKRIKMPNVKVHSDLHVVVENQIAMGKTFPAEKVFARLMTQGLSRHDAIHAIASVVTKHFYNIMKHGSAGPDPNADYVRRLENLNAEDWLNSLDESEDE